MTDTTTTRPSPQDAASTARDEAANVASTAKDEAASVASTAIDEAKHLGSDATEQAKQVLTDARQQLQAKAQEESQKVASAIGDVGQQLRAMADAGQSGLARDLIAQAADSATQLSHRLEQGGLDRTLQDARRLARNRPGVFLLGAAAAGFVAARVARTADTGALKEAATPGAGNGQDGSNGYGDGVHWGQSETSAPQARPTTAERPLVADPVAPATETQTLPISGGPS